MTVTPEPTPDNAPAPLIIETAVDAALALDAAERAEDAADEVADELEELSDQVQGTIEWQNLRFASLEAQLMEMQTRLESLTSPPPSEPLTPELLAVTPEVLAEVMEPPTPENEEDQSPVELESPELRRPPIRVR